MRCCSVKNVAVIAVALVAILLGVSNELDGGLRKYYPTPNFDVSKIPPQNGRVAVITGANVGLGKETAIQLAKKGAKVVLACRSSCDSLAEIIKKNGGDAIAMKLDLSDSISIHDFAETYRKMNLPIHMLILNAGVMALPTFTTTKDNLEMQVGVNWIGHFYLQHLLQDIVEKSAPSRIIILTSKGHKMVTSEPPTPLPVYDNAVTRAAYHFSQTYGLSKLLNLLHAKGLDERMRRENKKVEVVAVHPGAVDTDLFRYIADFLVPFLGESVVTRIKQFMNNVLFLDVHNGALTQLWAATSKDITEKNLSGSYAVPIARIVQSTDLSYDTKLRERAWKEAEEIIKKFPRKQ